LRGGLPHLKNTQRFRKGLIIQLGGQVLRFYGLYIAGIAELDKEKTVTDSSVVLAGNGRIINQIRQAYAVSRQHNTPLRVPFGQFRFIDRAGCKQQKSEKK